MLAVLPSVLHTACRVDSHHHTFICGVPKSTVSWGKKKKKPWISSFFIKISNLNRKCCAVCNTFFISCSLEMATLPCSEHNTHSLYKSGLICTCIDPDWRHEPQILDYLCICKVVSNNSSVTWRYPSTFQTTCLRFNSPCSWSGPTHIAPHWLGLIPAT